jgi:hypothetical protein
MDLVNADRWVGVGRSNLEDAYAAGKEAASIAISGEQPKLLVVFSSDAYDLSSLLRGINDESGHVPLIGCSTAGEIATEGPGSAGVVAVCLGGTGFSVSTEEGASVGGNLRDASARVASAIDRIDDRPYKILMLLSDGLAGDQQEVVRGAYGVVGAGIPLVGGCAGDDLKMRATYQFHGDKVLEASVVGAAIGSDAPLGIGVQHGWRKVGEPMLVTGSSDNRVYTLDDQPALDVYLNRLGAPAEAWTDPSVFTRFAMTHPLGLTRRSGEEVRYVAEAGFEDRSIGCIAEVPKGGMAWLMEGDDDSVLAATEAACGDALGQLGGRSPIGLIAFDCIARRGVLGEEGIKSEVRAIGQKAGGVPVAGFYTYGEFARTQGMNGFHNQTLVILALA